MITVSEQRKFKQINTNPICTNKKEPSGKQRTEKTQSERENKLPDGLKRTLKTTEEKANKHEGS